MPKEFGYLGGLHKRVGAKRMDNNVMDVPSDERESVHEHPLDRIGLRTHKVGTMKRMDEDRELRPGNKNPRLDQQLRPGKRMDADRELRPGKRMEPLEQLRKG